MSIQNDDLLIVGRGSETKKFKYQQLVSSLENDITFPSATPPGDGALIFKDESGTEIDRFTANQATGDNTDITIPSVDLSGVVKLDNKGIDQTITGPGDLIIDQGDLFISQGNIEVPGGGTSDNAVLNNLEIQDLIADSVGTGNVTVNLGYDTNGNSAGTVTCSAGNDADIPIATNNTAGLFTGQEKQQLSAIYNNGNYVQSVNLSYQKNGAGVGTIKCDRGTDADIPTVSSSASGLMTPSQKQALEDLQSNSGGTVTGQAPIVVDANQKVGLNYANGLVLNGANLEPNLGNGLKLNSNKITADLNRGLKFSSGQIEAKLGARLQFDSNGNIESDAPPDSVDTFAPIVVLNSTSKDLNLKRNDQESTNYISGTFTVPDGATRVSMIARAKVTLFCDVTGAQGAGSAPMNVWCKSVGVRINFGNGVNNPNTGDSYDSMKVDGMCMPMHGDRNTSIFVLRMNELEIPGTGSRTISYSCDGQVADASGDDSGTKGKIRFGSFNMLLLPSD